MFQHFISQMMELHAMREESLSMWSVVFYAYNRPQIDILLHFPAYGAPLTSPPRCHVCHFRLRQTGKYRLIFCNDARRDATTVIVGMDARISSWGLRIDPSSPCDLVLLLNASCSAAKGWGVDTAVACWTLQTSEMGESIGNRWDFWFRY